MTPLASVAIVLNLPTALLAIGAKAEAAMMHKARTRRVRYMVEIYLINNNLLQQSVNDVVDVHDVMFPKKPLQTTALEGQQRKRRAASRGCK